MKKYNIKQFKPCKDGLEYYETQVDFETAWNNCQRGDWMLWIAKKLDVNDRIFTLAKAHCANTVRHLMKDLRSIDAVDAAIMYGNGDISREELNKFAAAHYIAPFDHAASAAADAVTASFSSAASAYAAADAAAAYAAASSASSLAASVYAAAAARKENRKQTADICREYLTDEIFNKIK